MPKTKVVNQTGSRLVLKEGTGGVYRTVCPILLDKGEYTIKVDPNATYREYWCAETADDAKHVVLSSDDCVEYGEVRIRLKEDKTYTWEAVKRRSHGLSKDVGDREAPRQPEAPASSSTSDSGPGVGSRVWNKVKGWFS